MVGRVLVICAFFWATQAFGITVIPPFVDLCESADAVYIGKVTKAQKQKDSIIAQFKVQYRIVGEQVPEITIHAPRPSEFAIDQGISLAGGKWYLVFFKTRDKEELIFESLHIEPASKNRTNRARQYTTLARHLGAVKSNAPAESLLEIVLLELGDPDLCWFGMGELLRLGEDGQDLLCANGDKIVRALLQLSPEESPLLWGHTFGMIAECKLLSGVVRELFGRLKSIKDESLIASDGYFFLLALVDAQCGFALGSGVQSSAEAEVISRVLEWREMEIDQQRKIVEGFRRSFITRAFLIK